MDFACVKMGSFQMFQEDAIALLLEHSHRITYALIWYQNVEQIKLNSLWIKLKDVSASQGLYLSVISASNAIKTPYSTRIV